MSEWLLRAALVVSLLYGCGADVKPLQVENHSQASDSLVTDVIANVEAIVGQDIDLDGYTLRVWPALSSGVHCAKGVWSCSNIGARTIDTPWLMSLEGESTETVQGLNAYALCHELGHVFYYQTTGDSDPQHTHHVEWFAHDSGSVCDVIQTIFSGEVDL